MFARLTEIFPVLRSLTAFSGLFASPSHLACASLSSPLAASPRSLLWKSPAFSGLFASPSHLALASPSSLLATSPRSLLWKSPLPPPPAARRPPPSLAEPSSLCSLLSGTR
ncbi:hypothetical protein Syun_028414 [Stephania yunnanensis]|uniref:Uncharacterized protein n=1 Tax=Stephania yunnanensis TaxID=152371 RepID=A0AAP0EPN6_9MAGN